MPSPRTPALAYVTLSGVDTWLAGVESTAAGRARLLTKPTLMPLLAAHLLARRRTTLTPSTLAAEALSWTGDLALLGPGKASFLGGVAGFSLAHGASIIGFRRLRDRSVPVRKRPTSKALAGVWLVAAPPLAYAAGREDPVLGVAVGGYAALLVAMAANAAALDRGLPGSARRLTTAGAMVFLVSDTTLATEKFVLTEDRPWVRSAVMATYTLAQWLLAEGAARA